MTLPQMAVACGAALRQALRLVASLRFESWHPANLVSAAGLGGA
jgi:hypothetical protein